LFFQYYRAEQILKRGLVIAPDGAAALFERGDPQQTAKRDYTSNIQNAASELPLHIACGNSPSDGRTLDMVKLISD